MNKSVLDYRDLGGPLDARSAFGYGVFMDLNRPALEAMGEINNRFIQQLADFNTAWAAFVQRRLGEDLETAQQLSKCGSMQEWFQTYSAFLQTAQQQYQAEFAELARLGQSFSQEAIEIIREKIEDAARRTTH